MNIVHIAYECVPVFKKGGLGDVVGSLPKFLAKLGNEVTVLLPDYPWIEQKITHLPDSSVKIEYIPTSIFTHLDSFDEKNIQATGFFEFSEGCVEYLARHEIDIVHCHDWHAGLVSFLFKKLHPEKRLPKFILTIHNSAHLGSFNLSDLPNDLSVELESPNEASGLGKEKISYLKIGIEASDVVTTVSPNFREEIVDGVVDFGLSSVLAAQQEKFVGIVNGIDYSIWNPEIDQEIMTPYDAAYVADGKQANKLSLQKKLKLTLNSDLPLFGIVTRIVEQKGIDLIIKTISELSKLSAQLVILGTGDPKLESLISESVGEDNHFCSFTQIFDEKLAHQIYAASDFFLIPSRFEPCGLTQMIAMSYGSIPIVSQVGGLMDTVEANKTGLFIGEPLSQESILEAVKKAIKIFHNNEVFTSMRNVAMKKRFSWDLSAQEYQELYERLVNKN